MPQNFLLPPFSPPALPGLYFTFRTFSVPLTLRPLQIFLAPSLSIWLLLMSRWISTLLTLRASARACAPSFPMLFQDRLSVFSAALPSGERREISATACTPCVSLYPFSLGWDRTISQVTSSPAPMNPTSLQCSSTSPSTRVTRPTHYFNCSPGTAS